MEKIAKEILETRLSQYPWWSEVRTALVRDYGSKDEECRLVATLRPTSLIQNQPIDINKLTYLSADDLIDRFLKRGDYRIVAEEGEADDIATPTFDDEEDIVSEELAEIYLNQGLYSQAIETYHKLSLLNSEKSVYFAGLIEEIKDKMTKN